MGTVEPSLKTEHPPHAGKCKKVSLALCRIVTKTLLFLLILTLSIHFSSPYSQYSEPTSRQMTVQEIALVLQREAKGLTEVSMMALAEAIHEEATRYDYDPKFLLALISIESSFRTSSVSPRGAMGLMQLMPYVAQAIAPQLNIEWHGDGILFDPLINIKLGSYYLNQLIRDFKHPELALLAYNYGPTYVKSRVERKERIPLGYCRKVISLYQNL